MPANRQQDASLSRSGPTLTRLQRRALSVAALGIDERSIRRAYADPTTVRESTLARILKAARELGFPEPSNLDRR